jgi:hypothetical protein
MMIEVNNIPDWNHTCIFFNNQVGKKSGQKLNRKAEL